MSTDKQGRICKKCEIRPRTLRQTVKGKRHYRTTCSLCTKYRNLREKAKSTFCRGCTRYFHPVQLDVDHVNGKSSDNRYENLQILCSCCHRLKTHLTRDNRATEYR